MTGKAGFIEIVFIAFVLLFVQSFVVDFVLLIVIVMPVALFHASRSYCCHKAVSMVPVRMLLRL